MCAGRMLLNSTRKFGESVAGELLLRLKAALLDSDDEELRSFGERSLVPSHQAHRTPIA